MHQGPHGTCTKYVETILDRLERDYLYDRDSNPIPALGDNARAMLKAEIENFQFHLKVNLVGGIDETGKVTPPNFLLNKADPRLGGSDDTTQIFDRFYKDKASLEALRAAPEFQKAVEFRNALGPGDFNSFNAGLDGASGLERIAKKYEAAKKAGIESLHGIRLADIELPKLSDYISKNHPAGLHDLLDRLKNASAFFKDESGSAPAGGKFAGLSNKLGAVDMALIGALGLGLYQISKTAA